MLSWLMLIDAVRLQCSCRSLLHSIIDSTTNVDIMWAVITTSSATDSTSTSKQSSYSCAHSQWLCVMYSVTSALCNLHSISLTCQVSEKFAEHDPFVNSVLFCTSSEIISVILSILLRFISAEGCCESLFIYLFIYLFPSTLEFFPHSNWGSK